MSLLFLTLTGKKIHLHPEGAGEKNGKALLVICQGHVVHTGWYFDCREREKEKSSDLKQARTVGKLPAYHRHISVLPPLHYHEQHYHHHHHHHYRHHYYTAISDVKKGERNKEDLKLEVLL